MEQKKEQKKKKRSRLFVWFRRLFFGPGRELSFLEEEQVQSPMRSIVSRFFHNRIAMTGVVIFAACLLLVLIGPLFLPLDLSYSDSTQQNVPPSMGLAEVPAEMKTGKSQVFRPARPTGWAVTQTGRSTPGDIPGSRKP